MKKIKTYDIVIALVLIIIAFICLVPILNTIAISFSDKTSAAVGKVSFLPINFTLSSYAEIVREGSFFRAFWVSVQRVLLGSSINIILVVLTAYPLSKSVKAFRHRNIYMWVLVFTMLFNGGLIPNFLLVRALGLLDSIWALVLPFAVPVFSVIIMMNFFKGIPQSMEEAAVVDGAKPLMILTSVYIPLAKASIATIALFSVVFHWNEFFFGKIYINSITKQPLQTYIQTLVTRIDMQAMQGMEASEIIRRLEVSSLTFNSAKVIVSMIPILVIYPYLQKYFVTGIVMGAVKE